jgi:hypothetical protein
MEQYSFTAFTDSTSATTKQYDIILDIGTTIIKCGFNDEFKLYERFRQLEFFSSDVLKQIIVKYKREFFTDSGTTIEVIIPNIKNECTVITFDRPSQTITTQIFDTNGNPSLDNNGNPIFNTVTIPAIPKFTFWDMALGIPLIRKFIVNAVLEDIGLNDFFDQNKLLHIS